MGCSPSKSNNFGVLDAMRKGKMLPPPTSPPESPRDPQIEDEQKDGDTKEKKPVAQTQVLLKETTHMTLQKKRPLNTEGINTAAESSAISQRKENNIDKQDFVEKRPNRKHKKNPKGAKVLKKKERDKEKPPTEQKVDFPEPLVKAHQATYAFLNPSINRYDVILGLLEQATQTQVSVQPMAAFMALRYEEIIQALDKMVEEGEKVLKENGEHLAWPSQMKNLSSSVPPKSGSANIEPTPDLLQQLLQYTTQRMKNVSQTVGRIGDSALEEAVEYFASLSELLEEKLKAKQAAEARLMRLLTHMEMASLHKLGPDDSALFSEDSGIGAENESLAGSEKHHRRESCESTETNQMTLVSPTGNNSMSIMQGMSRRKLLNQISPSVSLTSLNSLASTCTLMANDQRDSLLGSVSLDDGEDDDKEEEDKGVQDTQGEFRKRSNSSPINPGQQEHLRHLPPKRIENPRNIEMTLKMKNAISSKIQFVPSQNSNNKAKVADSPKTHRREWTDEMVQSARRPLTAAAVHKAMVKKTLVPKQQRSRSAESLRSKGEDPTLLELERTQKDLTQRLQRMNKGREGRLTRTGPSKQNQATSVGNDTNPQPLKTKAGLTKGNIKQQDISKEVDKNSKGPPKATPPPTPPLSPGPSCRIQRGRNSVKKLIDTFSQGIEELEGPRILGPLKGVRKCGVPVLPGLGNVEAVLSAGITSCRPESTDNLDLDSLPPPPMEVLMDKSFEGAQTASSAATAAAAGASKLGRSPVLRRAVVSQRLKASVQTVTVLPSKGGLPQASRVQELCALPKDFEPVVHPKADSSSQQSRKILLQKHSSESQSERLLTVSGATSDTKGCNNPSVPEPNTTVSSEPPSTVTSQSPVTPLVSRGRMLPATPSSLHQRLPSPQCFKKQHTLPSSANPTGNRTLPTQTGVQRRLPSPPVSKQNIMNSNSPTSYPIKAPSPPVSPKVRRWSRENSSEELSNSRTVSNARSVFCPVSPSLFEAQPSSAAANPPQAWMSNRVSVLSRAWESRGWLPVSVQRLRPFVQRSQSDRRPSLNLPQRTQWISVAETCGSEPAICSQG
ncbi:photoreceptor cilium actin regulator [Pholidichthys leucotaenia]